MKRMRCTMYAEATTVVACAHCQLEVPAGQIDSTLEQQFCCSACRAAFAIIHEHGLDRYYALPERRVGPAVSSGRSYDDFDHATFVTRYVRQMGDGRSRVELYLQGVHCASCVWLVERLPLVVLGVARAELNVRTARAVVEWDATQTSLSQIARALDALGYAPHPFRGADREALRRAEDRAMLVRIGVAGAIAINVMLAALALYAGGAKMETEWSRFFRWISLALVTPAMIWPARVFFSGAIAALRTRTLNMDVPIAIGLAAGFVRGAINTFTDSGPIYFDGLATLTFALLGGRYLQQRGQRAAHDATELLFSLTPSRARLVQADAGVMDVPSESLLPGMIVDVRSGDVFPADGEVVEGATRVDASLLTGESRPLIAAKGDRVFAGTTNVSSGVRVRVTETGESSRVARLMQQVSDGASHRAPVVETANRLAGIFVAAVLVLAVVTWAGWQFVDPSRAVDNAIALLVVTCPCALALSTPLAVSVAIGRAAANGILIKGGDTLERLATPAQLVLDKTGTVTAAKASVTRWNGGESVKPLVLALEAHSNHPIANAFRYSWSPVLACTATDVQYEPGGGIEGNVGGRHVLAGSRGFVRARIPGAPLPDPSFNTQIVVAVDGCVVGIAEIGDPVREDAAASIRALKTRGWRLSMLSGDEAAVVTAVGESVGLDRNVCIGSMSPEDKRASVNAMNAHGSVVMVGDGVNDAAAMATAAVGIGVHGGAEACLATADVYLATEGLAPLVRLSDGAQRTMRVIRRNIAFSLVYNAIGASLAIAGVLSPLVAAVLMPASSLTVVIASWRSETFARTNS